MLKFDVVFTMDKETVADALHRAPLRRASKGRLIGQTVALGFVFVWCLAAFILDETHELSSLFIALAAVALGVVMWFVPKIELARIIDETAEHAQPIHLWVFENGVDFSQQTPDKAYYGFSELQWFLPTDGTCDTIVWRTPAYDVVAVPKAALTDEQWAFLMEKAR